MPVKRGYVHVPADERFASKVEKVTESGCWIWMAELNNKGYARFSWFDTEPRYGYAHRWAYMRWRGPIQDGYELDHLCRVTCCVNPNHLEAVTPRENILRSTSFSAKKARQTHCAEGHELKVWHRGRKPWSRWCPICYPAKQKVWGRDWARRQRAKQLALLQGSD